MNTFGNKAPFAGKIVSVERIVGPKATGETTHIIIDHQGKMPYWEGQSFGVIPPGFKVNSKGKEVPHGVRLYSIASSRYGDAFDGKTATLCVRRATYWDSEKGKEDPEKKGICSNFLCDAKPGTVVQMTGPTGKVMLLPEDPATVHIMVATGTGIAPFRSYIRRFFCEDIPSYQFKGLAWLFMGVANSDAKLYDDEFQALVKRYPDQFRIDYALSREQNNSKGGKMYIQDKVEEYKDQVFDLLTNGAHMYFCGLKGMMPGILEMLEKVCKEKGINYEEWLEKLKHEGRMHIEGAFAAAVTHARSCAPLRSAPLADPHSALPCSLQSTKYVCRSKRHPLRFLVTHTKTNAISVKLSTQLARLGRISSDIAARAPRQFGTLRKSEVSLPARTSLVYCWRLPHGARLSALDRRCAGQQAVSRQIRCGLHSHGAPLVLQQVTRPAAARIPS
jgi:ferredoxin--NADP+ reductase